MKIGILLYEGFSAMDVAAMQEILRLAAAEQQNEQLIPVLVAQQAQVKDRSGFVTTADETADLTAYDVLLLPGCSTQALIKALQQSDFINWLSGISSSAILASADSEARLWSAAGKKPDAWLLMVQTEKTFFTAANGNVMGMLLKLIARISTAETQKAVQSTLSLPSAMERTAQMQRRTAETNISAMLNLDGTGKSQLNSGIPFLDHMLHQIAVHGMMDLVVEAQGDLEVDVHHTLEDIGIVLGKLTLEALGNRKGIQRCASTRVPMDESLAEVTIDFSGRAYCIFEVEWHQPEIGGIPASLFKHFFESFSVQAACNLHIRVPYGADDHHQIEAIFKSFARAVDAASQRDPRRQQQIPSSKGVL
ncbi:MAG: imidazoleglycerol-phosphate dehydratase HisB [Anaerolineaceae bacterium]|nr:imidazoleglycerol-phosphate dehydratase HisB [Anaerolineaceae bacterium]